MKTLSEVRQALINECNGATKRISLYNLRTIYGGSVDCIHRYIDELVQHNIISWNWLSNSSGECTILSTENVQDVQNVRTDVQNCTENVRTNVATNVQDVQNVRTDVQNCTENVRNVQYENVQKCTENVQNVQNRTETVQNRTETVQNVQNCTENVQNVQYENVRKCTESCDSTNYNIYNNNNKKNNNIYNNWQSCDFSTNNNNCCNNMYKLLEEVLKVLNEINNKLDTNCMHSETSSSFANQNNIIEANISSDELSIAEEKMNEDRKSLEQNQIVDSSSNSIFVDTENVATPHVTSYHLDKDSNTWNRRYDFVNQQPIEQPKKDDTVAIKPDTEAFAKAQKVLDIISAKAGTATKTLFESTDNSEYSDNYINWVSRDPNRLKFETELNYKDHVAGYNELFARHPEYLKLAPAFMQPSTEEEKVVTETPVVDIVEKQIVTEAPVIIQPVQQIPPVKQSTIVTEADVQQVLSNNSDYDPHKYDHWEQKYARPELNVKPESYNPHKYDNWEQKYISQFNPEPVPDKVRRFKF